MADASRGHRIRSPSRNPIPDFLGSSQFSSLRPGSSKALGPGRSRGVKVSFTSVTLRFQDGACGQFSVSLNSLSEILMEHL